MFPPRGPRPPPACGLRAAPSRCPCPRRALYETPIQPRRSKVLRGVLTAFEGPPNLGSSVEKRPFLPGEPDPRLASFQKGVSRTLTGTHWVPLGSQLFWIAASFWGERKALLFPGQKQTHVQILCILSHEEVELGWPPRLNYVRILFI